MPTKLMLQLTCWVVVAGLGLGASGAEAASSTPVKPDIVPWPKSIVLAEGALEINASSRIVIGEDRLIPLASVLSDEIYSTTAIRLTAELGEAKNGDIVLRIDKALQGETYALEVADRIVVRGGNYRAVAWGTVTALQSVQWTGGTTARVPKMSVLDEPVASYRGLLIDVGRKWHPVESMRPIIEMCRLYKINYLQMHLNDNTEGNVMAFPFKAFPQLATERKAQSTTYTREDIVGLVAYADARGVTIIPELSGPGAHAGPLRNLSGRGNTLDVWNEKTYEVMKTAIGELCEVFASSPWIHIGGDEGVFGHLGKAPEEIAFRETNAITCGPLDYYIKRVDSIIKGYGKKTICWEGFHGNGSGLPKDITVMPYESQFNPADKLVKHGFPLINTAWKPLYVVGGRRWEPEYIYDHWNMWLWEHHINLKCHIQLKETDPVIGAQICAWEQPPHAELPSTRTRIAAMSERTWNPSLGQKHADYAPRAAAVDKRLDRVLNLVNVQASVITGSDDRGYEFFTKPLQVTLHSPPIGRIHYTLDGKPPTAESPVYTEPITIKETDTHFEKLFYNSRIASFTAEGFVCTLLMRIYNDQGSPLGDLVTNRNYWYKGAELTIKEEGLSGEREKDVEKFAGPLNITLTASGSGTIRYTVNGKDPVGTDKAYDGPIALTYRDCAVQGILFERAKGRFAKQAPVIMLRARLFGDDGKPLPGLLLTKTYWYTGAELPQPADEPAPPPTTDGGDKKGKKKMEKTGK